MPRRSTSKQSQSARSKKDSPDKEEGRDYVIETDGRVVWINGPVLLGRFSRTGIDVHVDGHCVGDSCSPGPCTIDDWKEFQKKMLDLHQINVPDKHMPRYLRGE